MDTFFEILDGLFKTLFSIVIAVLIICWASALIETLNYTKQNNVLLRELCTENGLNVDSLINTTQNDALNSKIDLKGK